MNITASIALIDIEGTVGSIAFVRDVLFPYASERIDDYVRAHQHEPWMQSLLAEAAHEANVSPNDLDAVLAAFHEWSDHDVKITPLKDLQGRIWAEGFTTSGIQGHLYPDAIDALRRFHDAGVALYVYSSGSVPAQKLLFGHTVAGDLLPLFSGFYDTTIGGKRERTSYERIVGDLQVDPGSVIFFSDVAAELDAAAAEGLQTVQLARPEDGTVPRPAGASVPSFEQIVLIP